MVTGVGCRGRGESVTGSVQQVHLDTHVVVWLAAGQMQRFTAEGIRALNESALFISPMVRLELQLLHDVGRITMPVADVLESVSGALGLREAEASFADVISAAIRPGRAWHNRDPFDRLIMASAIAAGAVLLTKDGSLRELFPDLTLWD